MLGIADANVSRDLAFMLGYRYVAHAGIHQKHYGCHRGVPNHKLLRSTWIGNYRPVADAKIYRFRLYR